MDKCVYCEKTDDLNTQFSIKLEDDIKVTVDICDDHAEEATIKTAREAYQANQDKIVEVMKLAKSLGLNITEAPSGLAIATEQPVAQPAMIEQSVVQPVDNPITDHTMEVQPINPKILTSKEAEEGWIDTGIVDSAGGKGMQSVGGNAGGFAVTSHSSHTVGGGRDHLPQGVRRGKVKMLLVAGRGGQPLAIPEKRIDGTGTTRMSVVQKEDDHRMQKRFKEMATVSRSSFDNTNGPDFRSGYKDSQRTCPICRGDCVIDDQECPKCDGMGTITVF